MKPISYMTHELIKLPFEFDALEPYMDKETVEIHYSKHHQGYVNNLNKALENHKELQEKQVEDLLLNLNEIPEEIRQAVINQGGGVFNHNLFWNVLKKDIELSGEIKDAINETFGSFDKFKEELTKAATTVFGSGWAWLALKDKKLVIEKTKNQDSVISNRLIPILALDVWEHSYYLKYQNRRPEYIENFFKIIDWEKVNELYLAAKK